MEKIALIYSLNKTLESVLSLNSRGFLVSIERGVEDFLSREGFNAAYEILYGNKDDDFSFGVREGHVLVRLEPFEYIVKLGVSPQRYEIGIKIARQEDNKYMGLFVAYEKPDMLITTKEVHAKSPINAYRALNQPIVDFLSRISDEIAEDAYVKIDLLKSLLKNNSR